MKKIETKWRHAKNEKTIKTSWAHHDERWLREYDSHKIFKEEGQNKYPKYVNEWQIMDWE